MDNKKNLEEFDFLLEHLSDEESKEFLEGLEEINRQNKEILKEAKKKVKENHDDIKAQMIVAALSTSDLINRKKKFEKIIKKAHDKLTKDGIVDENDIGHYWLIHQARPYMIARNDYLDLLLELGMLRKASIEANELIKLSDGDNMGVRFTLMHIFAALEDEEGALSLINIFGDEEVEFLVPLSVLYFKLDDLKKSEKYLRKAQLTNKYTKELFESLTGDYEPDFEPSESYMYNSLEQLENMYLDNKFLYEPLFEYLFWADEILNGKQKKK